MFLWGFFCELLVFFLFLLLLLLLVFGCFLFFFSWTSLWNMFFSEEKGLGQANLWKKESKIAWSPWNNQRFFRRQGGHYRVSLKGRLPWRAGTEEKRMNKSKHIHEMGSISVRTEEEHTEYVPFQEDTELTETKHKSKGTSSKGTAVGGDWFTKPAFLSWLSHFGFSLS